MAQWTAACEEFVAQGGLVAAVHEPQPWWLKLLQEVVDRGLGRTAVAWREGP